MIITTIAALVYQSINYFKGGNYGLLVISILLIFLGLFMVIEARRIFKRGKLCQKV
jgi:ABC-type Fe3+ transport system permease subunit